MKIRSIFLVMIIFVHVSEVVALKINVNKYFERWMVICPVIGAVIGLMIDTVADEITKKYKSKKALEEARQKIFDKSEDLAVVDPEFYEGCCEMMKDYGITEPISFRVVYSESEIVDSTADKIVLMSYVYPLSIMTISSDYKKCFKHLLIRCIAHELEHHRQYHKYLGSLHVDFCNQDKNDMSRRLETAADATSLDYQHCTSCLAAQGYHEHQPEETEYGYFTSPKGYATGFDVELYYDRAKTENFPLCLAHEQYGSDAHMKKDIPLKMFLSRMKPSLPTAKFSDLAK